MNRGKGNKYGNNNNLPPNVVSIPMQIWTDPTFWENENEPEHFVVVNGKKVPNNLTLNELGLAVTQNNVYSDPGEYNTMSPLELPPLAVPFPSPNERISRSYPINKKRRSTKKAKKSKAKRETRNNRFGFKKALGALQKGFKKLTGRSRKNRRN